MEYEKSEGWWDDGLVREEGFVRSTRVEMSESALVGTSRLHIQEATNSQQSYSCF